MKKGSAWFVLVGYCALLVAVSGSAAPAAGTLALREDPVIQHLLVPGQKVDLSVVVDTAGVTTATGSAYVRSDLDRRFARLPLKLAKGKPVRLHATVPARFLRGQQLPYYFAVSGAGRSATLPAGGASTPLRAWELRKPFLIPLGTHRFGHTRGGGVVVARAGPEDVGFQTEGSPFGPQAFTVGKDGSVWVRDGLNTRLLVWQAGRPGLIARRIPLPTGTNPSTTDIALGSNGSVYAGNWDPEHQQLLLDRVGANGSRLWQSTLASEITNAALRIAPGGDLVFWPGSPGSLGGERRWRTAAAAGKAVSTGGQERTTSWGYPVSGGLRLYSVRASARETRLALVDGHNRLVRAWRVTSRTDVGIGMNTPEVVGGDVVVVLDVTQQTAAGFKWEYEVLRLGKDGRVKAAFPLARTIYGDNLLADVRVGPDGRLYQLGSSPATGLTISRFTLG